MRVSHFFTGTLTAITLLFASCATPQLATNNTSDDVYNTMAEAKVYRYSPPAQPAQEDQVDQSGYISSYPQYDMDYSSRIDRFYYGNHRPYFDDYYNFYGYNYWYNPFDVSVRFHIGWGANRWYNRYAAWGYYVNPYYSNFWGPYSYYDRFGYGAYGNYPGYGWGNSVIVGNSNNKPRPTRGDDSFNNGGRYNGTVPSRGDVGNNGVGRPTRNEVYNPATNGTVTRPTTTSSSQRPTRQSQTPPPSRPVSTPQQQAPTYTPPPATQSTPPPTNTGGSSGSSETSRPTRAGGRG